VSSYWIGDGIRTFETLCGQRGKPEKSTVPARVVRQAAGNFWGRVAGELSRECCGFSQRQGCVLAADDGADWPGQFGDWVAAEVHGIDTTAVIQEVSWARREANFVRKIGRARKVEETSDCKRMLTRAVALVRIGRRFQSATASNDISAQVRGVRGLGPVIVLKQGPTLCDEARGKAAEIAAGCRGAQRCNIVKRENGAGVW